MFPKHIGRALEHKSAQLLVKIFGQVYEGLYLPNFVQGCVSVRTLGDLQEYLIYF